jgi:hypothetical protein
LRGGDLVIKDGIPFAGWVFGHQIKGITRLG